MSSSDSTKVMVAVDGRSDAPLDYVFDHYDPCTEIIITTGIPSRKPSNFSNPFIYGGEARAGKRPLSSPTRKDLEQAKRVAAQEQKEVDSKKLWQERMAKRVEDVFRPYREACQTKNRKCQFVSVEYNQPSGADGLGAALCDTAVQFGASDLVVGFRGLSSPERLALGSVSGHCAQFCSCNVTIVKHPNMLE